jgi:hypothetical protein
VKFIINNNTETASYLLVHTAWFEHVIRQYQLRTTVILWWGGGGGVEVRIWGFCCLNVRQLIYITMHTKFTMVTTSLPGGGFREIQTK